MSTEELLIQKLFIDWSLPFELMCGASDHEAGYFRAYGRQEAITWGASKVFRRSDQNLGACSKLSIVGNFFTDFASRFVQLRKVCENWSRSRCSPAISHELGALREQCFETQTVELIKKRAGQGSPVQPSGQPLSNRDGINYL